MKHSNRLVQQYQTTREYIVVLHTFRSRIYVVTRLYLKKLGKTLNCVKLFQCLLATYHSQTSKKY